MKIKMLKGKAGTAGMLLEKGKTYDTDRTELDEKDAKYLVQTGAAEEVTRGGAAE